MAASRMNREHTEQLKKYIRVESSQNRNVPLNVATPHHRDSTVSKYSFQRKLVFANDGEIGKLDEPVDVCWFFTRRIRN